MMKDDEGRAWHDEHVPPAAMRATVTRLHDAWRSQKPDHAQRLADLTRLRTTFERWLPEMVERVGADFGHRSRHETLLLDGALVLATIDRLRRHLARQMRSRRLPLGWRLWPARAELRLAPLGVVGVMAPWTYPVNLALIPLATAIAAGNHVYLRPAAQTPRSAGFLRDLLAEVFPPARVAVLPGTAGEARDFAALPFDHLVFTGSPAEARVAMTAAATNLTPMTLQLGGKSPAVICADYPVDKAAARLVTGKFLNAGQSGIAPDYVLVEASIKDALIKAIAAEVRQRYGTIAGAPDLTRIIDMEQLERLQLLLDDARARGLELRPLASLPLGHMGHDRILAPTLVLEPPDEALVMRQEIAGPILPIRSFTTLDQAIDHLHRQERLPLIYPFSTDRRKIERLLATALASAATVNDTLSPGFAGNFSQPGIDVRHGWVTFEAMSRSLPVFWQSRRSLSDRLRPPYIRLERLIAYLAR